VGEESKAVLVDMLVDNPKLRQSCSPFNMPFGDRSLV
jgi:hypothetical protein